MSIAETKSEEGFGDARIYEVGYLVIPTVSEENISAIYGDIKDLVNSLGGNVISDDMPKMMPLAYQMEKVIANINKKFDSAYFGWTKFEMDPEKIADIKKKLEMRDDILRLLIVKTIRENTIATKRFSSRDTIKRRTTSEKREDDGAPVEINKEEIDKEIEALVATE